MKKDRVDEFDIVRGIGVLTVIAIHVTSIYEIFPAESLRWLLLGVVNKVCAFAVPLFLFLSAAQLAYGAMQNPRFSPLAFYKRRFRKTVPIYLLWVAIYYLYLRCCGYPRISPVYEPGKFLLETVLQGKIFYHMYFMPLIFQLYLLFPAMLYGAKYVQKTQKSHITGFLTVFAVLAVFQGLFHELYRQIISPHFQNSAILVFTYMLTIGMGIWVGTNYGAFRQNKTIKLFALMGTVIFGYLYVRYTLYPTARLPGVVYPIYTTCAPITVLCLAMVVRDCGHRLNRILRKLGAYSFTIYLVHPMILDRITTGIPAAVLQNSSAGAVALLVLIRFALTLGGAYLIAALIDAGRKRIPALTGLSGKR